MSRPGFMFYFNWRSIFQNLPDDQRGKLLLAMLDYAETGQSPRLDDPVTAMAWHALWPRLDEDARHYDELVRKRREAINKRWEKESAERGPARSSPPPTAIGVPRSAKSPTPSKANDIDKYINW